MLEKQYYIIKIKENNSVIVYKVDYEKYFDHNFNYVYHTQKGETYPLYKDLNLGTDEIFVDGDHLDELLDDLKEQGVCDFDSEVIE